MQDSQKYRYLIRMSFKGTRFHGWQDQPNALTVQGILNEKLSMLLGRPINATGAGRTDTGVHAAGFYAHFDGNAAGMERDHKFLFRLNCVLPPDIAVQRIIPVPGSFHARYDAISRTYRYTILKQKDPFRNDFGYYLSRELNIKAIRQATEIIRGYEDFKCFSRTGSDVKNHICRIMESTWEHLGHSLVFTITANRFLRNMVRAIAGTMIDVGTGKMMPRDLHRILESRDRSLAGRTVPARGLCLTAIKYPEGILD